MIEVKLGDKEIIKSLQREVQDIILYNDGVGATNFYKNLQPLLEKNDFGMLSHDIKEVYEKIISQAKLIALTTLSDKEVVELIDKNIKLFITNPDIDLWHKLEGKLRTILILEDRDELKLRLHDSLAINKTVLFNRNFIFHGKKTEGTVADWLSYYQAEVNETGDSNIRFREFLTKDNVIRKLSQEDEEIIEKLFVFYKRLTFSSFSFEGIEDYIFVDDGKNRGWIREGQFTPEKAIERQAQKILYAQEILQKALGSDYERFFGKPSVKSSKKFEKIDDTLTFPNEASNRLFERYKLRSINWKDIITRTKDMSDSYNNSVKFSKLFHQAINSRDKENIIVALLVLARQGHLDEIFVRDKKIKEIFKAHLAKKFSDKLASDMEANLQAPIYLSYFLQHLLKDILKMDENESAVLAIKLVNELKRAGDKQYIAIAYGDLQSGTFKWKTIMEKDDKLELAES